VWNGVFGNPDLYQPFTATNRSGRHHRRHKSLCDQGRTIIAYDTSAATTPKIGSFLLTSTTSRVRPDEEGNAATSNPRRPFTGWCDSLLHDPARVPGPRHVDTLTITWDIGQMLVSQPGTQNTPPAISGHWHSHLLFIPPYKLITFPILSTAMNTASIGFERNQMSDYLWITNIGISTNFPRYA